MCSEKNKSRQVPAHLLDIEIVRKRHEELANHHVVRDTVIGQYHSIMAKYFTERIPCCAT